MVPGFARPRLWLPSLLLALALSLVIFYNSQNNSRNNCCDYDFWMFAYKANAISVYGPYYAFNDKFKNPYQWFKPV